MKKLPFLLALTAMASLAGAQSIGIKTARHAAKQYLAIQEPSVASDTLVLQSVLTAVNGDTLVYAFNIGQTGFILTGTNKEDEPIVGYSLTCTYDEQQLAPSLRGFLNGYLQDLQAVHTTKSLPDDILLCRQKAQNEWTALIEGDANYYAKKGGKAVSALIQTHWSQGAGYNNYCPTYSYGDNGHSVTGCVATAMAQIIRYHSYPDTGFFHSSYGHPYHGTQSAQYDSSFYDYSNMPDYVGPYSPAAQQHAVSLLCYHCGVSVKMNYENPNHTSGSGAQSNDVPAGLRFFGYTNTHYLVKGPGTNAIWDSLLKHDLDNGWPVYYSGSNSEYGHAFVCDGYNNSNKYHFNFGWGYNAGDGFYSLSSVNGFSSNQAIVYNIVPSRLAPFHDRYYIGPDTLGGGNSWSNTNANLEAAMSICGLYKQGEIWVKSGTYTGDTTSNIAFTMPQNVTIYGGFQGTETTPDDRTPQANPSIMSGKDKRLVLKSSGLSKQSYIYNMTFAHGKATDGAAVMMERNLWLEQCTIRDNTATTGAAINSLDGNVICCKIFNNHGGAVKLDGANLKNSLIAHNDGYGIQSNSSSFIDGCNIVCNNGVGIKNSDTKIRNCVLWHNDSSLTDNNIKKITFCAIEGFAQELDSNSNFGILHDNNPSNGPGAFFKAPDTTQGPSDSLGDWHLSYHSALIDAGDTSKSGSYYSDLDDGYRFRNSRVDIGCYEYNKTASIPQSENPITLSIYPNPATHAVTIEGCYEEIEIYDMMGRKVLSITPQNERESIDISSLNPGIYIIRNKKSVSRLIKL